MSPIRAIFNIFELQNRILLRSLETFFLIFFAVGLLKKGVYSRLYKMCSSMIGYICNLENIWQEQ